MQQYFASSNQSSSNQSSSNQITLASSSNPASITAERSLKTLRVEQVEFFDSEYQQEQGNIADGNISGSVANVGKYVYYRDIYVFVNRLKVMIKKNNVKSVISECLRGTALMWYSTKLTDLKRDLLEDSSLN